MQTCAIWPMVRHLDGPPTCSCGISCGSPGKHPRPYVEALPGEPYAVVTGNGLLVVDVDLKPNKNGFASISEAGWDLPDTYTVGTPTGGEHRYYSHEPEISCGSSSPLVGVDFRGDNSVVVGPGSPHHNGGVYVIKRNIPISPAPPWLIDLAKRRTVPSSVMEIPQVKEGDERYQTYLARCIKELQDFPPAVAGEGGDTRLFLAAQIPVRRYQLPPDVAETLLIEHYNPRCQPPWSGKELGRIAHKVREAATRGDMPIGPGDWLKELTGPSVSPPAIEGYSFTVGQPRSGAAGKISPANILNTLLTHPEWEGVWRKDVFKSRLYAHKPPMFLNAETVGLSDTDITRVANWFELCGFMVGKEVLREQIELACECNPHHPVVEYLDSLPEPSTNWLQDLALRLYGDPSPWAQRFLTNTLVGAIRRILEPGCAFDYALVLYGPQGVGKSKSIQDLFGVEFSSEQFPDLSDMVRACQDIQGYWAIESAELHKMLKSDNAVKDFVTRRVDAFTRKYGRYPVSLPRQCIFIGTTNEEDFLRDKTGNRRYWPIKVQQKIDRKWIKAHRDEIWSEALALAKGDFCYWFEPEEDATIDVETRDAFTSQKDAWYDTVRSICAGREAIRVKDIFLIIDTEAHALARFDNAKQNRIVTILRQLGCTNRQRWIGGKNVKVWEIPEDLQNAQPDEEEALRRALEKMSKN